MRRYWTIRIAAMLLLSFAVMARAAEKDSDVVEVLKSKGHYTTFIALLDETGILQTLRGEGPYTVFAPADEAFAKIAKFDEIVQDKPRLKSLLRYHIAPISSVASADLPHLKFISTLSGQNLNFKSDDGLRVNEARITEADMRGKNGVVHGIDAVLSADGKLDVTMKAAQTTAAAPTQITETVVTEEPRAGADVKEGLGYGANKVKNGLQTGAGKIKRFFTGGD